MSKNFLEGKSGDKSIIRLCSFIAIISIAYIVIITGVFLILCIFLAKDELIKNIASILAGISGMIGTLATVILYKAIQTFGEKKDESK